MKFCASTRLAQSFQLNVAFIIVTWAGHFRHSIHHIDNCRASRHILISVIERPRRSSQPLSRQQFRATTEVPCMKVPLLITFDFYIPNAESFPGNFTLPSLPLRSPHPQANDQILNELCLGQSFIAVVRSSIAVATWFDSSTASRPFPEARFAHDVPSSF